MSSKPRSGSTQQLMLCHAAWASEVSFEGSALRLTVDLWRDLLGGPDAPAPGLRVVRSRDGQLIAEVEATAFELHARGARCEFRVPTSAFYSEDLRVEDAGCELRLPQLNLPVTCPQWLGRCMHRGEHSDVLASVASDQRLTLTAVRRTRRTPAPARHALRGTVVLMHPHTGGGKTRALLSLAEALQAAGMDMTVLFLSLTRKPAAFPVADALNLAFGDAAHFASPFDPAVACEGAVLTASAAARDAMAAAFRQLASDFVYVPNYDSELYDLLLEHLPASTLKVLGDHAPGRCAAAVARGRIQASKGSDLFVAAMQRFDAVHVLLEPTRACYQGHTDRPVFAIPNVVEQPPQPVTADVPFSSRRIVAVGRLVPPKQMAHAITAFAKASAAADPSWVLEIYGRGAESGALERQIAAEGLAGRVRLCGFDPRAGALFQGAALHLSASRFESFGLTFIEAMHAGVPTVAYGGHPGADALLGGDRGLLARHNDVESLATVLGEAMRRVEASDPDLVAMAARGREYARGYLAPVIAEAWVSRLQSLIERKRTAALPDR